MKVFVVTIDDIEDGHPDKVFDTREKAEAYLEEKFQEQKALYDALPIHPAVPDFVYTKDNFYGLIVEMELE